jgi:hypothetical protein
MDDCREQQHEERADEISARLHKSTPKTAVGIMYVQTKTTVKAIGTVEVVSAVRGRFFVEDQDHSKYTGAAMNDVVALNHLHHRHPQHRDINER